MQDVIQKIKELYTECENKSSSFDSKMMSLDNKASELSQRTKQLDEFKKVLDIREAEIKKVENVIKLEQDARQALQEAREIKAEAEKLIQRKDDEIKSIRSLISNEKAQAEAMMSEARAAAADIDRRKKVLEEEKLNYKQSILEELIKKSGV